MAAEREHWFTMGTNYTEFLGEVQHRIGSDTQAEAARTMRAVLEGGRTRR